MLERFADKAAKIFSKKTVEHTKTAIVEDVKKNQTGYIMAGISGLVIAAGVVIAVKAIVSGIAPPAQPLYSITYNYYITMPPAVEPPVA